ncbi:MAG TPA: ABC transporter substrate-binding protein [Anaerolineales bacterium]|nr:ABC transporter substrate-binding protein [Anaerolineales bacterium]
MRNKFWFTMFSLVLIAAFTLTACGGAAAGDSVKIGLNIEITGDKPKVGEQSKFAAEMFQAEVNEAGGIDIGGKKYQIELVIEDNNATPDGAVAAANKLISQDNILIMVGPNPSNAAVPAGEVANNNETPMISPWSTNPNTTLNRPWVFRAPFLDPFQGPVVANFATNQFGADQACVLFDVASDYPKGLADNFKTAWEALHGAGSVVAFESFTTGDQDFSAQLTKIKGAGCDVLFTPQYYQEVPLIVSQSKDLGITMPIVGSDSWGDPQLLELCGANCEGYYFSTHYVASGAKGATKEFIDKFNAKYAYVPGDVAALTWDAMRLAVQAMQNCGTITGNLADDRTCIRDGLASIKDFAGITGNMTFDEQGDPIKCAVIVEIKGGEFLAFDSACP